MEKMLASAGIIPVITPDNYEQTVNVVNSLVKGGITTLEIVLRTPAAVEILAKIAAEFKHCVVGAGTVTSPTQMEQCQAAGAQFIVTPGNTEKLLQKAQDLQIPILPGVASASDILRALEYDLNCVKLFPANLLGGLNAIKTYAAVFPHIKFCPTGGINLQNLSTFCELKSVIAVGGTWLTPQELILNKDWSAITKLAEQSLSLLNLRPQ